MNQERDHEYAFVLGVGTLRVAHGLLAFEDDRTRKNKKKRVIEEKSWLLVEAFPERLNSKPGSNELDRLLGAERKRLESWPETDPRTLLIDLAFADPFAPYELKYAQRHFETVLKQVAPLLGVHQGFIDTIREAEKAAKQSQRKLDVGRVALFGVGGAVLLGTGAWLAAPAIGAALGSAAGLSGAAATGHGLALLGGGTLAAGGAGMAGGMAAVAGAGATAGLLGGGGGSLLVMLGANAARAEIIKLQVNYKAVLLQDQAHTKKAQEVIKRLEQEKRELRQTLDRERKLNEDNAGRVKALEATLDALARAIEWSRKERDKS